MARIHRSLLAASLVLAGLGCVACTDAVAQESAPLRTDEAFWKSWGDGKAELAGYALTYPRYGVARQGNAVAVFVTETFSNEARLKNETAGRPPSDLFPVIKLNLMQEFPTGIYDYNLMTSAFVALSAVNGRDAGTTTKVAFSSQEWCGQVYAELNFADETTELISHSYFDGEGREMRSMEHPSNGLAEDSVLLWARGLAAPVLQPGQSTRLSVLRSLEVGRLSHVALEWQPAVANRAATTETLEVPAGRFEVRKATLRLEASRPQRQYPPGGGTRSLPAGEWVVWVMEQAPHTVVKWRSPSGAEAELVGTSRLPYWAMNGPGLEQELRKIGLEPAAPRTR